MENVSRPHVPDCAGEEPAAKQIIKAAQAVGLQIVTGPSGIPLGAVRNELADIGPEPVAMQPERLPAPARPPIYSLEEWDADASPRCCFCGKPTAAGEDSCHSGCLSDALNNFDMNDEDDGELELADGLDLTIGDDADDPVCDTCFCRLTDANSIDYGRCRACRRGGEQ